MRIPHLRIVLASVVTSYCVGPTPAAPPAAPTYWEDVRPIFRRHCTACHSTKNINEVDVSGGLALDTYDAVMKLPKKPVVVPGKSGDSSLVHLLVTKDEEKRMPRSASPLSAEKLDTVRRWIDAGAAEGKRPDTDATTTTVKAAPRRARKLDVTLPTSTTPPAGALGQKSARLELSLKVGPLSPVTAVAFSPDGKLLAAGSYGHVAVWDLAAARPVKVLTNVLGAVNDLRFSPDGQFLAAAGGQPSAKGDLRLYQVADWKLLGTFGGHEDVVFGIAFSPDGKQLASASFDKTVRLWTVADFKTVRTFTGHSDFVYAVAFSPDGQWLASASKDRTVKVVRTDTGKSLFTFSGMDQDVMAVAVRPDGKTVVSSGFESSLYWWDPQAGKLSRRQGGHGVATHEVCFSTDGKLLASAGGDRTAKVWDADAGTQKTSVSVGSVTYAVALSPEAKLLATGSFDGLVRLWEVAGGRQLVTLLTLPAEGDHFDWLALTAEGYSTGSLTLGTLGRWQMDGTAVAAAAVGKVLAKPELVTKACRGETVPAPTWK